jgi:glycosyltransferase involved in cell wall biosynthesis
VLDQTFSDYELVVVDNASEDNTPDIVRSLRDSRIRYYRNVKNIGVAQNWNRCIDLARGEYITIFHDDDVMLPENLSMKVKAFENRDVNLVFCAMRVIDAHGNQMYIHRHYPESRYLPGREQIIRCLKGGNCIGCPSIVAIKTSAFEKAGKFNETLLVHTDTEMWLRILLSGDAYFLADPLVSVRQHEGSDTKRIEQAGQIQKARIQFVLCYFQNEQIHALLNEYPKVKQFSAWLLGWFNFQLLNLEEARKWLIQVILIRPLSIYSVKASIVWLVSFLGKSAAKSIVLSYHSFLNPAAKGLRKFGRYLRRRGGKNDWVV